MSVVEYKINEAREKISAIYDRAARGGVTVISKGSDRSVAAVPVAQLTQTLALVAPLAAQVSFSERGVAAWLPNLPVHAEGADLEEAVERLAEALVDYVDLWEQELSRAPNQQDNWALVARVRLLEHAHLVAALSDDPAD